MPAECDACLRVASWIRDRGGWNERSSGNSSHAGYSKRRRNKSPIRSGVPPPSASTDGVAWRCGRPACPESECPSSLTRHPCASLISAGSSSIIFEIPKRRIRKLRCGVAFGKLHRTSERLTTKPRLLDQLASQVMHLATRRREGRLAGLPRTSPSLCSGTTSIGHIFDHEVRWEVGTRRRGERSAHVAKPE